MIVVVGLGPAGPELTTPAASEALAESAGAGLLHLRTGRHPAAEPYRGHSGVESFDDVYERAPTFEAVYEEIVARLLAAAASPEATGAPITYAVPGSPVVAERSVSLLRQRATRQGIEMRIVPGLSFLELAWSRLGVDPLEAGVRLADGVSFAVQAAGDRGPWLVGQCWSRHVLSEIKLSVDEPDGRRAVLLHHLGLPDEVVVEASWDEIDRTLEPDHLTSLYVPGRGAAPMQELAAFLGTVERLRHDCPWDREQTHQSLVRHLLEETYEAIEAIEGLGDSPAEAGAEEVAHVEEELGDLLCQVAFHAVLGAEEGLFTLADVARTVNAKLVFRHPHVFGDVVADTAVAVTSNWERIKQQEKQRTHLFEGIPATLPALARAAKVERKLASVDLGWEVTGAGELGSGPEGAGELGSGPEGAGELGSGPEGAGEALLGLARELAHAGADPEAALRHALDRLGQRVGRLEARSRVQGADLSEVEPATLRRWWEEDTI